MATDDGNDDDDHDDDLFTRFHHWCLGLCFNRVMHSPHSQVCRFRKHSPTLNKRIRHLPKIIGASTFVRRGYASPNRGRGKRVAAETTLSPAAVSTHNGLNHRDATFVFLVPLLRCRAWQLLGGAASRWEPRCRYAHNIQLQMIQRGHLTLCRDQRLLAYARSCCCNRN